jgi:hypothetical protein
VIDLDSNEELEIPTPDTKNMDEDTLTPKESTPNTYRLTTRHVTMETPEAVPTTIALTEATATE